MTLLTMMTVDLISNEIYPTNKKDGAPYGAP